MGKTWKRRHDKTPPKTAGRKAAWNHVPTKRFPTRRSVEEAIEREVRDELA